MVSRAILSVSPSKAPGLDTRTREQSLDSLCYLKERITAVEGILVQSRDRADAVSPRLAASNLDTARYAQSARTPAAPKSQRPEAAPRMPRIEDSARHECEQLKILTATNTKNAK